MQIQENIALAPYTTFHIGGPAKFFAVCANLEDVREALAFAREKGVQIFVYGGGSNVLVSDQGFDGLVLNPQLLGLSVIYEDETLVHFRIGAGENWDRVVEYAVGHHWWGIENLSHIPGNSGALVVQNVGAYGQEASDVVESVETLEIETGTLKTFSNKECGFTYRHSVFNTTLKNKYIVLAVTVKLSKNGSPNLSYGDMAQKFEGKNPSLSELRQAVTEIRDKKFPYPSHAINGNAGSFFRGKLLIEAQMQDLEARISAKFGPQSAQRLKTMQGRLSVPGGFKTPTAYLLELCGLKGYQVGGAKVNEPQPAIVLNATGTATAKDVLSLSEHVMKVVKDELGVELEIEPELVGF